MRKANIPIPIIAVLSDAIAGMTHHSIDTMFASLGVDESPDGNREVKTQTYLDLYEGKYSDVDARSNLVELLSCLAARFPEHSNENAWEKIHICLGKFQYEFDGDRRLVDLEENTAFAAERPKRDTLASNSTSKSRSQNAEDIGKMFEKIFLLRHGQQERHKQLKNQ